MADDAGADQQPGVGEQRDEIDAALDAAFDEILGPEDAEAQSHTPRAPEGKPAAEGTPPPERPKAPRGGVDAARSAAQNITFTRCGPLGTGTAMKLTNNFVSAGTVALLSEALAFGIEAGLELEKIVELVGSTYAGGGMLTKMLPARAFKGDFGLGFRTRLSHKDQRLALKLAEEAGLDAPVGKAVLETLERTIAAGFADDDFTSMLRVNEAKAGVKIRLSGANDA